MAVAEIRAQLVQKIESAVSTYADLTDLYRGWLSDAMLDPTRQGFADKVSQHLASQQAHIRGVVQSAIEYTAIASSELTGDVPLTNSMLSTIDELKALTEREIFSRIMAQLQMNQQELIKLASQSRLQLLVKPNEASEQLTQWVAAKQFHRPDALGRRRNAEEYIRLSAMQLTFQLLNTLTYTRLIVMGETQCALDHALKGSRVIPIDQFLTVQRDELHPRSTVILVRT